MKTSELRIGNYVVHVLGANEIIKINAESFYSTFHHGDGRFFINLKGLPLSEELLLKVGYRINQNHSLINDTGEHMIRIQNHMEFSEKEKHYAVFIDGNFLLLIKYLHQLQNLIFTLTEEEIIVNL